MRSHLTAIGTGLGLAALAAIALAVAGSGKFEVVDEDGDGASSLNVVSLGGDDRGTFRFRHEGLDLTAQWKGDFAFAADGRSLTSIDGDLEIEKKQGGVTRRAVYKGAGAAIDVTYAVDGKEAPAEGAGELLLEFARRSGVNAEARAKALIAAGGVKAALDEIDAASEGRGAGAYIEAIAREATLSESDLARLIARIAKIDGDYQKRTAIAAILKNQDVSAASSAALLEIARAIDGDHEKRLVIEALAEKEKLGALGGDFAVGLIADIDGDHEIRLATEALLDADSVGSDAAAALVTAALTAMEGDYESRLVVERAAARGDDAVAAAAISGLAGIEGAHEKRLAIEAIAEKLPDGSAGWPALIAAVEAISGDHDRRLAIEALYDDMPATDDLRARLKAVAEKIGSDHDRRLALDAME